MVLWGVNFAFVKYLLDTLGVGAFLFIRFVSLPLLAFLLLLLAFVLCAGAARLRAGRVVGTLVAGAGIGLFLSDKFAGGVLHAGYGDLILLVAASLFSLYTVLARPLVERYGPLIVLAYTLAFGAPPMVILSAPSMFTADLSRMTLAVWLGLFWAIVLSSVGGWLVWAWVNLVRGIARSA